MKRFWDHAAIAPEARRVACCSTAGRCACPAARRCSCRRAPWPRPSPPNGRPPAGQGRRDALGRRAADPAGRHRAGAHRPRPRAGGAGNRPLRRERPAVLPRRRPGGAGRSASRRTGSPGSTGRRARYGARLRGHHRRQPCGAGPGGAGGAGAGGRGADAAGAGRARRGGAGARQPGAGPRARRRPRWTRRGARARHPRRDLPGRPLGPRRRRRRRAAGSIGEDIAVAGRFLDAGRADDGRRLVISGRVQGVGFRDWMVREAGRLGVSGWVRNRRDGTVEALVDGDTASVEELLRAVPPRPAAGRGHRNRRGTRRALARARASAGCPRPDLGTPCCNRWSLSSRRMPTGRRRSPSPSPSSRRWPSCRWWCRA